VRFEITPTPEETLRGCQALVRTALPPDRSPLIIIGITVVVGIIGSQLPPITAVWATMMSIDSVLLLIYLSQWYASRRLRALMAQDTHGRETHVIELSADGVESSCSHMRARYPWSDYARASENGEFILLCRAGGAGNAIPKRLLTEASEAELRERLGRWLTPEQVQFARRVK
jgi:hypothetical protein